ncbi:hypothetical protein [Halorussus halophilus]|uniref:hypothetical protein n=1 Tax=Halorussus halophilus TaxID=2650975 RepID=UPI001300D49E|nr:hypothetical protein [Halorussus halophilus]
MSDRLRSTLRRNWWLVLLATALVVTIPAAYVLAPPSTVGFAEWVGVFGTVTSLALSLILAVLYREMSETQRRQTELMERQQRLIEREQEPVVEVQEYSIETSTRETRIVAEVANKGASPIRDLTLGLDLVLYRADASKIGVSTEHPVVYEGAEWTIDRADVPFRREGATDATGKTHLESGETATLVAPVTFRRRSRDTERAVESQFEDLVGLLEKTEVGMVKLHASLLYTDWSGRPRGRRLDSGKAELGSFETLDELFASERPHSELPPEFLTGRQQQRLPRV